MKRKLFIVFLLIAVILGLHHFSYRGKVNSSPKQNSVIGNIVKDLFANENEQDNIIIFNQIIKKAKREKWNLLPLGELIARIGYEFINTPYEGFTLEGEPEKCTIKLSGLDCVTLFENTLCLARNIKKGKLEFVDLINEVTFTRYRNGKLTDYTSRLHYTAEWINDNVQKGVVRDITKEIGGIPFKLNLNFMSTHPDNYVALKNHPEMIEIIAAIEQNINQMKFYYIPKKKIKSIENKLQNGDIIAFATDMKGLDYTHTGLVYVDANGIQRLMHASSVKKKVVIDTTLSQYILPIKKDIGITILRPIDEFK